MSEQSRNTLRNTTLTVTVRCRAFSGESVCFYKMQLDGRTMSVAVWDSVAGHYTHCHALSPRTERRIVRREIGAYLAEPCYRCHGCGCDLTRGEAVWADGTCWCEGCAAAEQDESDE